MLALCLYITWVAQGPAQVWKILRTKMHKVRTNKESECASFKHEACNLKQACNEFEFQTQHIPPHTPSFEKREGSWPLGAWYLASKSELLIR